MSPAFVTVLRRRTIRVQTMTMHCLGAVITFVCLVAVSHAACSHGASRSWQWSGAMGGCRFVLHALVEDSGIRLFSDEFLNRFCVSGLAGLYQFNDGLNAGVDFCGTRRSHCIARNVCGTPPNTDLAFGLLLRQRSGGCGHRNPRRRRPVRVSVGSRQRAPAEPRLVAALCRSRCWSCFARAACSVT